MESKTKRCTKCLEEKPLELFSINRTRPDDHESRCKDCMKKKMQDYRDRKRTRIWGKGMGGKKNGGRKPPRSETKVRAPAKSFPTVTRATPEQIIADLRRGLAIEIIDMIQEKFGL